jgi:glycosyltransferase involved in cell wall biosynthesis
LSDDHVKHRLRVLTMVDGLYGGAEELAWQVAQRLDPTRFSSTLCVTRWSPSPEDEEVVAGLRAAGIDFIGMDRTSRFDLRPWRVLVREMRERRIDILHTHKLGSNSWGALIAPRVPVSVFVAHEHTWSWRGAPHRKLIDRYLVARRASALVAVSEADRRRMTSVEGIPPRKTRFIANGIPKRERNRANGNVRAELGLRPDQPVVGMVANLRPQKAYDVLIRAAGLVRDDFRDLRLLIVGSDDDRGTQMPLLEALVRELKLEDAVSFLGRRKDVFDVIDVFDVAVLSSDYEGSPLAVMEYMEAAKVVVATRVGGVPDQVIDGETGLLVEPRDPELLAAAITSLLRDPARARAMGEAGRERQLREFSIERTTLKVEELYEELYTEAAASGTRPSRSVLRG